jgi:hypothetical protein
MRISINLLPKRTIRERTGLTLGEQLIGGLVGGGLGVLLIVSIAHSIGEPAPPVPPGLTTCERLISMAQTQSDSLQVFMHRPDNNRFTCMQELQR